MLTQFPVGIIEINSFMEIVAANATMQEWLKEFFPELKGLSCEKLATIFQKEKGVDATEQDFPYSKALITRKSQPPIRLLLKSGNQDRWLMMHTEPAWQGNTVTGLLSSFTDVTSLILVEEDLKKQEKKFRGLLESAPDAMVIVNEEGIVQFVNRQTEKLFEFDRAEIIGKPVELLLPDRVKHAHKGHRTRYFEGPKVRQMGEGRELYGQKKSGIQFPVEISLSPLETEEGLLVSAAIRDITERRKAEEKFRGLLESAPDAMVIVNEKGIIQLVNAQTEKLFEFNRSEIIGQPVELLLPDRYSNTHHAHRTTYFHSPKFRSMGEGRELYGKKKHGQEFPVEISLSPLETEDGLLVSAAIRDISEKKQMAREISEANVNLELKVQRRTAQLEEKNKELEQFAYVASHDLQEPLRMVSNFLQLLQARYNAVLDDKGKEFIFFAVDGAARMKLLIQDLLSYSRVNAREMTIEEIDTQRTVNYCLDVLRDKIQQKGVKVSVQPLPPIRSNKSLTEQLFMNLVNNAIKYGSDQSPFVEIGTMESNEKTYGFYVKDNGIGINPKYFDKIFIIFQRLNEKSKYEGTGMGLAICKKIVEKHGGNIWVESAPGAGSTFYFTIAKNLKQS